MAVKSGTITGVTLLSGDVRGVGARRSYLVTVDFPAYTASTDTISIAGVGAAIATATKKGKTNTLRGAICVQPGLSTANAAVYPTGASVQALTVATDALTGQLSTAAGVDTTATACTGCGLAVVVDES